MSTNCHELICKLLRFDWYSFYVCYLCLFVIKYNIIGRKKTKKKTSPVVVKYTNEVLRIFVLLILFYILLEIDKDIDSDEQNQILPLSFNKHNKQTPTKKKMS